MYWIKKCDMLLVVKRRKLFPEEQKSMAFFDTELPLPGGHKAMFPRVEARVMQEVLVKKQEFVLFAGAVSGYLAAVATCRSSCDSAGS
jgi:protein-L-isoaspartate(D-aspartate) O-methyltransferase